MNGLKCSLCDYIKKRIIIPCYQRGYIWGKEHGKEGEINSVLYMMNTLEEGYKSKRDIFIQGITVVEDIDSYTVVDGQQRSTFFYLLLKALEDPAFEIQYNSSRGQYSQQWLECVDNKDPYKEEREDETQDIYFFKKTLRLIKEHSLFLNNKAENVCAYLKEHVKFLLIPIKERMAITTFTMMNGNKALMEDYELIKADLLRRASSGTGGYTGNASEWDNISLRSRYAHEWDKWLYWWNREDVQLMYNCNNPMGWLLYVAFDSSSNISLYNKDRIKGKSLTDSQKAKKQFLVLRKIQKKFEDAFSIPERYNEIGLVMRFLSQDFQSIFIKDYFGEEIKKNLNDLKLVYNLLLFNLQYKQIANSNYSALDEKEEELVNALLKNPIYGVDNELAYRYLLVRNVEEDSKLNRRFDFNIWNGNRSLEHIYPKSKVVHEQDNEWLDGWKNEHIEILDGLKYGEEGWEPKDLKMKYDEINRYIPRSIIRNNELKGYDITEHSIGNLLLLYGNNNSSFGAKMPEEKRLIYFDLNNKEKFGSRHLLHTVFSFGRFSKFGAEEICKNQIEAKKDIESRIEYLNKLKGEE